VDEEMVDLARELERVLAELKPIVDRSVRLRAQETRREAVNILWEKFLASFLCYARNKSQERGQNFFHGLSLSRVFGR